MALWLFCAISKQPEWIFRPDGACRLARFHPGGYHQAGPGGGKPCIGWLPGGFTDGRYGYLVPYINSVVARLDLQNFNTGGVAALDLAAVDSRLKGFEGGFTDGRYGYFVPHHNGDWSGLVARVDLKNFTAQGVTMLDLTAVDSDLKGFWGGFTDGRYGYFVPHNNSNYFGKLARVDLLNFTTSGVTSVNLAALDPTW